MDLLSELVGEIILQKNEDYKDDPIPNGAIVGFEDFKSFVNENQQPFPEDAILPPHYQQVSEEYAYLRTIQFPQTAAVVYVACIPGNHSGSFVREYLIPPLDSLIHNPEIEKRSPALWEEMKLEKPTSFTTWEMWPEDNECTINYNHLETWGLLPERRSNRWMTFRNKEDAQRYCDQMRNTPSPDKSPLESIFSEMLDEWTQSLEDEFINREFDESIDNEVYR